MAEKITYLDGLRGIAAVNVMIMHFFLVLAPAMVYGNQTPSHLGNLDLIFSSTPLGLIGAGNFSVCIFFVLSGYVLTQNYFRTRDKNLIISGALRRYIRLLIPVFASIMLSFLLSSAGLFRYYSEVVTITANNNPANYWLTFWTFTPNIVDAIKQATLDSFLFRWYRLQSRIMDNKGRIFWIDACFRNGVTFRIATPSLVDLSCCSSDSHQLLLPGFYNRNGSR